MRRREFIAGLGSAAAWPAVARAQQQAKPVVGFLHGASREGFERRLAAFHQGLAEMGYVEGRNLAIEYRWAEGKYDQLPGLAAELVRRRVSVIAAFTPVAALAAKAATSTIPIVFGNGSDPVRDGLVASINRPGGNITGANFFTNLLSSKQLELLHQIVPDTRVIAVLTNPQNTTAGMQLDETRAAARALGLQLVVRPASTEGEIDTAFADLVGQQVSALFINADAFFASRTDQIVQLAARHRIAVSFTGRDFVEAGGLMSYSPSIPETYRQVGVYVARILRGEKPSDLPIQRSTKFEFMLNLKTARALGLQIPSNILAITDEVIE